MDKSRKYEQEFDDAAFEAFLDSIPETEPSAEVKEKVIATVVQKNAEAEIIDLKTRRGRWFAPVSAAAAAVVLIAGSIVVLPQVQHPDQDNADVVAAQSEGTEQMHAIMEANDAVMAKTEASGALLAIVASAEMGKAGAMVDGQPELDDGMGAQVWVVSADGEMISAGVIGPDPHEDVWMPFPEKPMKVMVTEEPVDGSQQPTGRTLAEIKLSA